MREKERGERESKREREKERKRGERERKREREKKREGRLSTRWNIAAAVLGGEEPG